VNLRESPQIETDYYRHDDKLRNALDNINSLTASISGLIDKNSEPWPVRLRTWKFSVRLKQRSELWRTWKGHRNLRQWWRNRPAMKSAVASLEDIHSSQHGEGSLGKLLKETSLWIDQQAAEGVNSSFRYRRSGLYTFQVSTWPKQQCKRLLWLTLQPSPDKY